MAYSPQLVLDLAEISTGPTVSEELAPNPPTTASAYLVAYRPNRAHDLADIDRSANSEEHHQARYTATDAALRYPHRLATTQSTGLFNPGLPAGAAASRMAGDSSPMTDRDSREGGMYAVPLLVTAASTCVLFVLIFTCVEWAGISCVRGSASGRAVYNTTVYSKDLPGVGL